MVQATASKDVQPDLFASCWIDVRGKAHGKVVDNEIETLRRILDSFLLEWPQVVDSKGEKAAASVYVISPFRDVALACTDRVGAESALGRQFAKQKRVVDAGTVWEFNAIDDAPYSTRQWPALAVDSRLEWPLVILLPGFGQTPSLHGETSIRTLADEVTVFIHTNGLTGIDVVGSSMGARLVLELARRGGMVGGVVALDPEGFWQGSQRHVFYKHWDAPAETTRLILSALAPRGSPAEQDLALRAAG